jgi:type IV secretory pathway TraG/TraD family ATPase VirD4
VSHWNPLAAGNATELKDKLLGTERFTEPHYRRAAERYLQLAIQVALETAPGQPLTLSRVVELMTPERLAAATRGASAARAEHIRGYLGSLTPDQNSAVRGLASRLAVLTESHTGPLLEPGAPERTLDLRRALSGGEVVLFSLNSSSYGSLAAMLGTLAVQDLVAASGARLTRDGERHPRALIAIDEFSALRDENVSSLLARGREAGMGVLLATQELADLDRAGPGLKDQILGNTALKIVHRQDVPDSAQTVARLAGSVREWEESYQLRPGARGGLGGGVGRSARLVDRYRVEPERVRTLRTGEAVVVTKSPQSTTAVARIRRTSPGLER